MFDYYLIIYNGVSAQQGVTAVGALCIFLYNLLLLFSILIFTGCPTNLETKETVDVI